MTDNRDGAPGADPTAAGGSLQGSGSPDTSRTEPVDLTQFEDFRRYDAKMQQRQSGLMNENQLLATERDEALRELRRLQAKSGAYEQVLQTEPDVFQMAGELAGKAELEAENRTLREEIDRYRQATQAQQEAQQWVDHYTGVCRQAGVDPNDRAVQAAILRAAYNGEHGAVAVAIRHYQPPTPQPTRETPAEPPASQPGTRRVSEPTPPSGGGRTAAHTDVELDLAQQEFNRREADLKRRGDARGIADLRREFRDRGFDIAN